MASKYYQFKLVTDFEVRGDQARAIDELVEGLNRGDKAQVRRNQGSWVFAPFEATFTTGAGTSLSFALGDVDGDGDLDIVSTRAGTMMDSSVSYVQVNRVR